jgi:hypothetical protein
MVAECIAPVQGTRARIVKEDSCGAPVVGAGSKIVIDGFVQVQVAPQYEDGTVYRKRNAQGVNCVNTRGNDQFERDELTVEFCAIDPDAVVITTGQQLIVSGATGIGFWINEGPVAARFSLEVWQADSDTCTGVAPRYAYWAWPHVRAARLNDMTIEDQTLQWQLTAFTEKANTAWNVGAGYIPLPPPALAHRGFTTNRSTPPAVTGCGAVAYP